MQACHWEGETCTAAKASVPMLWPEKAEQKGQTIGAYSTAMDTFTVAIVLQMLLL